MGATNNSNHKSWLSVLNAWKHPAVISLFFLGISAGIPFLLIFSTLSVWLREAGIDRATVTFFSWAALTYSFKFLWAPLIDTLPIPLVTKKLGRRRGWLLIAQIGIVVTILSIASIDPANGDNSLLAMAIFSVLLGFFSATQDIVIDAYRIERCEKDMQALLSSTYIAGYRTGMLISGAGSLFLATYLGSQETKYLYSAWMQTYCIMAALIGCGMITTIVIHEPDLNSTARNFPYTVRQYLEIFVLFLLMLAIFGGIFFGLWPTVQQWLPSISAASFSRVIIEVLRFSMAAGTCLAILVAGLRLKLINEQVVKAAYFEPVGDFFRRYGVKSAFLLLLLIGSYRLSDIVMGAVANIFYLDMGFSKNVIAGVTKSFGLVMTLVGGFVGGTLCLRYGVFRILFAGAFLSSSTNLLFAVLAANEQNLSLLTLAIALDNLSAGLASAAFVAFLSSLTNISFTAVQYALFSSLMSLLPKIVGGYSGTGVMILGYEGFFYLSAVFGLPVLLLVWLNRKVSG